MPDILTRLHFDKSEDRVTVERVQDVEDILDVNKQSRDESPFGADFKSKWNVPNVIVERLYNKYNEGQSFPRPMNDEFWHYVDKIVMGDPDYAKFRTNTPANSLFLGYK